MMNVEVVDHQGNLLRFWVNLIDELFEYSGAAVTRGSNDDHLLAYAVVGEADYLVTGDKDLLVIQRVGDVKIITPVDFASLIENL